MALTLDTILKEGRGLFLAYDQGIEHGPTDFNEKNCDPNFILDIALRGGFTAVVLHKGVAEKYHDRRLPLILKLNGKTNLVKGEPLSRQVCSVAYALKLGAKAVGYTVYLGSAQESVMLQEFGTIVEQAHDLGIPVIAWMYPRGEMIKDDTSREIVAYATRAGLELGADAVKVKYTGDSESFRWAVKNAGVVKVFMSGGPKATDYEGFLNQVKGAMDAGASGLAVGRNVWQDTEPLRVTAGLREIVFNGRSVREALQVALS